MSQTSPDTSSKSVLLAWIKDPARRPAELTAATGFFPETDRAIAARVDCPPEVLATLSHSSDKATRAKVTANPNTPAVDYVRLGQQFPKEFIANPLLDLLLLENPALLDEVPTALLVQIAKKPECPAAFLIWASSHPDKNVQLAVAMNAKSPPKALERLRQSGYPRVRESVNAVGSALEGDPENLFREAVRERLGALTIEEAIEGWEKGDVGLAQFGQLPKYARKAIASSESEGALSDGALVRRALAANLQLPVAVLEALAHDKVDAVRCSVAKNASIPVAALETLVNDKSINVRGSVAENSCCPPVVLETLARDRNTGVRSSVAENPKTPFAVLEALAKDGEYGVRSSVARNPSTPVATLEALAKDKERWVRCGVAGNPTTPAVVLKRLAKDADRYVRRAAAENPTTPVVALEALATDTESIVRTAVAENSDTPFASLEALAKDNDGYVRTSVAKNPTTRVSVLEMLTNDADGRVREGVVRNPTCPANLLLVLSADAFISSGHVPYRFKLNLGDWKRTVEDAKDVPWVRLGVASNTSTPESVLACLAMDKNRYVRREVAGNPSTPLPVLATLSADKAWQVREAVCANPATPLAMVESLARDVHVRIRERVAAFDRLPQAVLTELADAELQWSRGEAGPGSSAFQWRLGKSGPDVREAVLRGDFLFFGGKNPDKQVLSRRTMSVVLALSAGPNIDPGRIARVSSSTDWLIRAAVARNRSTPPNLLNKLTSDAHPLVRALASAARCDSREGGNTQPEDPKGFDAARATVEIRKAFKGKVGKSTRDTVASDPLSPAPLLGMLSKDKDSHVRRSVARNPSTPVALLEALAKDTASGSSSAMSRTARLMGLPPQRAWDVPRAVARNLNTPVALLGALAKETDSGVRGSVAENRNTSVELLEVLAKDKDSAVRRSVAENPNTPVALLEALSRDMDSWVRESAAKNPSTPAATLEALAKDDERWVRHGVAGNPTTPVVVLERLAKDSDARDFVASNPSTPRELCIPLLEALAKDTAWQVRRSVAANPRTPVSVLRDLAKSKVELVRSAVAANPSTPASLLDVLAKDKEESVRQSAARTHQPPGALVEQPAQDLPREVARFHEEALAMLSPRDKSVLPEASILEWLERLFDLPAARDNKTLTKASRNKNWLLRLGVALHPHASAAMLEFLRADPDADVAAAARMKLSQRSAAVK